jgi:hypothetical protein
MVACAVCAYGTCICKYVEVERVIRVRGEEHIGGIMIKLVDVLDIAMDWSDHALWWPAKNTWLHNTRCPRITFLTEILFQRHFKT